MPYLKWDRVDNMSDWQVYLMMTLMISLMLIGKKMMFFDNKKDRD
jgi:hypothetical protein